MSGIYDNWERLVEATLKREELRYVALYCESFSSTSSSFSFDSFEDNITETSGPPSNVVGSEFKDPFYAETTETEISVPPNPQNIAYKELKAATKRFRPDWLIGSGSFGNVYKGWIDEHKLTAANPGEGTAVAVKKLSPDGFGGRDEWLTEISYLRQLHHPNLVTLMGHSFENDILLLVYEFMPKGSLDNHLFRSAHESLSWTTRIKVATGAARGLSFLHGLRKQVILRNISASNILLDREFNAKLTGFGLGKDGPTGDDTHVSTRVMGTYGYAAPEYVMTGHLTASCDVYGFGVILLELLCGRQVVDRERPIREINLVESARRFLNDKKKMLKIMDPKLEGQFPKEEAYSAAVLAFRCLRHNAKERPRMIEVLVELELLQSRIK